MRSNENKPYYKKHQASSAAAAESEMLERFSCFAASQPSDFGAGGNSRWKCCPQRRVGEAPVVGVVFLFSCGMLFFWKGWLGLSKKWL